MPQPDPKTAPERPLEADQRYLREHYTKHEHMVPMRDGVRLHTTVFVPKDNRDSYPIILSRSPYGHRPYGVDNFPREPGGLLRHYAKDRFIFAAQDVRGRNGSEGEFEHVRPRTSQPDAVDESTDTYDTVDWLVAHVPDNNGKVALTGISYGGSYAVMGMVDAHPALVCASPQAPMIDWFIGDDFHHNGVFYLSAAFGFLSTFEQKLANPVRDRPTPVDYATPDGYEFFLNLGSLKRIGERYFEDGANYWHELADHSTYDGFWQERNLAQHLDDVRPAVMTVGGWFDAEDLYGPLDVHRALQRQSPGTARTLVMGPWPHGGWHRGDGESLGNLQFHQKTSVYFRREIELPWLNHYLRDADSPALPEAVVFETGTDQWRRYDSWPPEGVTPRALHFCSAGGLSFDAPQDDEAYDEYLSDPAKPVPCIPNIAIDSNRQYMSADQRFAATRPDVLVYVTEPLEDDLTIAGPLSAKLWVSTTGTDSDWVVKLIDVYHGDFPNPDPNPSGVQLGGYQQLVRGEPFRGKFRNGFEHPEPFEPGHVAHVAFELPDVYHTFRRGHRIMVHVQSSWFPLADRNPQTFCDIYRCDDDAFQKATQRVYRANETPSHIVLPVLER